VQPEPAAFQRRLEVRQHHRHRGIALRLVAQCNHARDHGRLDPAQGIVCRIEPQHREKSVAGGGDGGVEIGVAVRVVHVRVAEQDVEHDGFWPLLFDLLDKLAQHLPRPRPAPVVLGHCGEARLVDVDDDDVRVGLGHDDAVTHHHVERRLLHVGGEVQNQRIGRDQEGEYSGQIEIEAALPLFRQQGGKAAQDASQPV
jgi:hypothetical protein